MVARRDIEPRYESRLALMEDWYKELIAHENREKILLDDYEPHVEFLGKLEGCVLDMGGGAGPAARFMGSNVEYVVVDPLELWDSPEWLEFGRRFRTGGPEPRFVKASGEDLPFADSSFDCVLSYWSLNHVEDPQRCIAEMARVLRPGGKARIVIDDAEPSWPQLIGDAAHRLWRRVSRGAYDLRFAQPLVRAFAMKLRGKWAPAHQDHYPIRTTDLARWAGLSMELTGSGWANASMTLDFVKPERRRSGP